MEEAHLRRAAQYLASRQQDLPSDWCVHAPSVQPGGWGFSDVNTRYPDVDDTAAAVQALYPYRRDVWPVWKQGVRWLIGMQNEDGGWGAFERDSGKRWLERLPINDMGQAMTDPSSADLTGRVIEALSSMHVPARRAIARGVQWLRGAQREDGSWRGRWGICFLYGTWAAVSGLAAAGVPRDDPALRRAAAWLCSVQHADGGFGESCRSDEVDEFVDLAASTPTQTAWGLMALLAAVGPEAPETRRAAAALMDMAQPSGGWGEAYPTGAGIAGQAYIRYHSYPMVWPLLALARYAAQCPAP
ncbi:prenyltransferase/squalene oxidase repeat-containing protein [Alicyclobacillus macrosporangiidus]|uniref:prenyltransferase/squalene oxidase repeat-containing protein n=1 Tax=Alicyclobacillus macrosporangiidus TaxID=392015 RepID=UPI0026EB3F86|nr:prenyltransferase/squalene oxidase repeat-containing protein [Alicyclobacillus macrosporangiidus]